MIKNEQASDRRKDQTRLSIWSRNAELKRSKITNSAAGSDHMLLLQEAESHLREQFHVYHGADQLILSHQHKRRDAAKIVRTTIHRVSVGVLRIKLGYLMLCVVAVLSKT